MKSIDIFGNVIENCKDISEEGKHWVGMPEFIQERKEPYAKIIIRFENENDLQDFARKINQKLTPKTKSIWHPAKSHFREIKKEWVTDES